MAKIIRSYESDIDLTIFMVEGEATFDEILEQTRTFLGGQPSKLALWDFTSGTVANISSQEVKQIAIRGGEISTKIEGGKAAILTPKDIDYGIGRVFHAFSEFNNFPLEVNIFRDINAAREWLISSQ